MGSKRSWGEANLGDDAESVQRRSSATLETTSSYATTSQDRGQPRPNTNDTMTQYVPMISRKVKACSTCRKHKIRCIMDNNTPPCRRCAEKGLGCVLNKSLQTLISERSQSNEAMIRDLEMLHSSIQAISKNLNLPPPGSLSSKQLPHTPTSEEQNQFDERGIGPSCDNSPKFSPADENDLPKVPIQSVYHLTKLSALRSPDAAVSDTRSKEARHYMDDFISRGALSLGDAERLFRLYMDQLDHYMYGIGGQYETLDELRRNSRILTVSSLTVAALHDQDSDALYGICSKEFRRLMAGSIFSRRIDRDYIRAMCIASYWLSDINWILSGYAIRRAAEFNLISHYKRAITEGNTEAADFVRLWYILHICDQHLSTLFGRQSVIREDVAIQGWEAFSQVPMATESDKRLTSQVALLNIMNKIRELFGPDSGEPVPQVYLMQIDGFSRQLNQWVGHWSVALAENHDHIGKFPRKGVLLHYHFARLHLYSHVFRGLRNTPIPAYFQDSAASAVAAATSIVNLLVTEPALPPALVGMPSYFHSMTAFACMFLAKSAMIHGDILIERAVVINLTTSLIQLYRSSPVGKWHLVKLMADGLEKIVRTLSMADTPSLTQVKHGAVPFHDDGAQSFAHFEGISLPDDASLNLDPSFLMDYTLGASQLMSISNGPTVFDTSDLSPPIL
ncbi:hypothetical protein F5Y19DRAFT_305919 [Xylariaceae sp. FL1651]|nr:hypothetical protein F5Y19DRAFT_305919 [Xylariaceae sp. FL1651]